MVVVVIGGRRGGQDKVNVLHTVLLHVLDGVVRVHVDGARGAFGGGAGKAGLDEVAVCTFVFFNHVGGDVGATADDDDLEDDKFSRQRERIGGRGCLLLSTMGEGCVVRTKLSSGRGGRPSAFSRRPP